MRIVYFGSSGPLSLLPLQAVLASDYPVCGVMLDTAWTAPAGDAGRFPVLLEHDDSVAALAALHGVPVMTWSKSADEHRQVLQQARPDLVLVSCFAKKLPDALLAVPRLGCFNLHPSRLPAYRGPAPVFWQLRDGVTEFGVTLHRMSSRLDAGNIIASTGVDMPDGVDARRAGQLLAQAGSALLIPVLQRLMENAMPGTPQVERHASYQGFPSPEDFHVSAAWSARRLYNFLCATCHYGIPYRCEVQGGVYRLAHAESYKPAGTAQLRVDSGHIVIPCNPGILRARLVPERG